MNTMNALAVPVLQSIPLVQNITMMTSKFISLAVDSSLKTIPMK